MPAALTSDYRKLLSEVQPQVIESDAEYDSVTTQLSELVLKGRKRTPGETRLMKLLALLVQDYDQRHALPPADMAPHETLRYLLDSSGKTSSDLLPVFGQRSHVHEALNGKRKISVDQARKLGTLFGVRPGAFI
jgi:HTH-type transcriptional regulator/antitoxin HigA